MYSAAARQLPGCSTTGRSDVQSHCFRYTHTAARQLRSRAFTSRSCSNNSKDLKRCLRARRKLASALQARAESLDQEEAELRADYGALSEKLEVRAPWPLFWTVTSSCQAGLCRDCPALGTLCLLDFACPESLSREVFLSKLNPTADLQGLATEVHALLQGNSLYLVGMMGSGKSTVGRLVGKALKYPLLDTDALIEQSSKATVSEIFAEEGEEAFRDMETEVLHVRKGNTTAPVCRAHDICLSCGGAC